MKTKLLIAQLMVIGAWLFWGTPTTALAHTALPTWRTADIVGGRPAEVGEWPWQAMVRAGGYLCGGSLVDNGWVVTAAHCVYDNQGDLFTPASFSVTLGDHSRVQNDGYEQVIAVTEVIPHPDYDEWSNENDIALLRLATPATLNGRVVVIEPVTADESALMAEGTMGYVTGWGTTGEGGSASAILLEVDVPVISNTICNASYGTISDNMLCAGYAEGGKDSCQGDSGGPFVVPDQKGGWRLAGIVSFGYGCARQDFYGVYTRVANYVEWMTQTMGGAEAAPLDNTVTALPDQDVNFSFSSQNGSTAITIPTGAVSTPTIVHYTAQTNVTSSSTNFRASSFAFALNAEQDGARVGGFTFAKPVTLVLTYADAAIAGLDEAALVLYTVDASGMGTEAAVVVSHELATNQLIVEVDHAGTFVLGIARNQLYLPLVQR